MGNNISHSEGIIHVKFKLSFVTFDKAESEAQTVQTNWTSIAKSLVFKEAHGSIASVRPDMTVPTWTVKLKSHTRLTPETYDRNIMDLEFAVDSQAQRVWSLAL